jgi:hypothetical protein
MPADPIGSPQRLHYELDADDITLIANQNAMALFPRIRARRAVWSAAADRTARS